MDLFSTAPPAPLAELLRPTTLDEVVGQAHLVGPKKPLRIALETKRLHSFLLFGPPGVGKTTLARLCAKMLDSEFVSLSAVTAGAKEIRDAVTRAQSLLDMRGRATVLFVDEVHRFNKAQQDLLLPHVESGLVKWVGATTEDPGFSVNSALLSRAQVYKLEPLADEDLAKLYRRAVTKMEGVTLNPEAQQLTIEIADGDARRFLNLLEQLQIAAQGSDLREVGADFVRGIIPHTLRRFSEGSSTTRFPPSRKRCAVPAPMARCTGSRACSTAGQMRSTSRAGSSSSPAKMSAMQTRGPCSWR